MPHLEVNGVNLHYYDQGEGEAIFFIPGLVGLGSIWEFQLNHFSPGRRALSFDHRGSGKSEQPEGGYDTGQIARDVVGLLDALGIGQATFVGASTGGCILQNLALDHADRVRRCVFTNTWTKADPYFTRLQVSRKQILQAYGKSAYVEFSSLWTGGWTMFRNRYEIMLEHEERQKQTLADTEILLARIDMTLAHDRLEEIPRISKPTLIIAAKDDPLTPRYFAEDLNGLIEGSRLVLLEEGGHNSYRRNPDAWNGAVEAFLADTA